MSTVDKEVRDTVVGELKTEMAEKENGATKSRCSNKRGRRSILEMLNNNAGLPGLMDAEESRPAKKVRSLSPAQKAGPQPAAKRRSTTVKFVAINEDAKPLLVNIPFSGQAEMSFVRISSHCVESRFDVGPLNLTGRYDRRSKVHIERFLQGFGRYIH